MTCFACSKPFPVSSGQFMRKAAENRSFAYESRALSSTTHLKAVLHQNKNKFNFIFLLNFMKPVFIAVH